jgi:hypothetical protein
MTETGQRFRGVMSPVLTPFNSDLTPSVPRFVKHCKWLIKQSVGLAIFGTNSEANSLSVAEKRSLLQALLDAGLPASKMVPGTGTCALPDSIELTRHAVQAGCSGVLILPPFYYKGVSDEGLFQQFCASYRFRIGRSLANLSISYSAGIAGPGHISAHRAPTENIPWNNRRGEGFVRRLEQYSGDASRIPAAGV